MPRHFVKGHPKLGGKRKGTLNKKTVAQRELFLKHAALSAQSTIESIRRGQQYDPRSLFNADGTLRPITELSETEAWAIAGFDVVRRNLEGGDGHTDTVVKIKLIDRRGYVELAAKYLGMLTDKLELSGEDALIQTLLAGRTRAASRKG